MHLLVLSAFRRKRLPLRIGSLRVSMHLLVLSAFRLSFSALKTSSERLNAPFGAQCFPTRLLTGCIQHC